MKSNSSCHLYLVLPAISAAVSLCLAASASAQQTHGSINGRAQKGDTVNAESKSIGVARQIKLDTDGSFQLSQLPPGTYTVTRTQGNGTKNVITVVVVPGEGTTASFDMAQRIEVVGSAIRTIDARATESATTFSKAEIDRIPVARNVTALTLLAPGAVFGDSRIGQTKGRSGNVPSLGGASPAENTYYVNGFNVTNILNGIQYSQIPFEAIGDISVKTGGYGAEFGRSLGGAVIVTTKRGTNEWQGGVGTSYAPKSMRGTALYPERNAITAEWELRSRPGGVDEFIYNVFGGGPLIKDKLFVFGLVQGDKYKSETFGKASQSELTNQSPRYLVKVDWNVTDRNLIELTAFNDKSKDKSADWNSTIPWDTPKGDFIGNSVATSGGENIIGKFTSLITDELSIAAQYGVGKYSRSQVAGGSDCPYSVDARGTNVIRSPGACYVTSTIPEASNGDKRTALRLDAEWALGKHRLKLGLDKESISVSDGTKTSGGIEYRLLRRNPGQRLTPDYVVPGGANDPAVEYIRTREFSNGGAFKVVNSAWYVEDQIDIAKNLVLSLGLRNESS